MVQTFTGLDWDELWKQTAQYDSPDFVLDDVETLTVVPNCLGWGYCRSIELTQGVWLDLSNQKFTQNWLVKIPAHDHLVQSTICLSGFIPHEDIYPTLGGQRSYFSGSGISPAYTVRYERSQQLIEINVHLLPEVFAEVFGEMATDALLKVLLKSNDWKASFFPTVTPAMRQVAQQILNSPLQGETRRFYLQAKVFELLRLQLQPLLSDQRLCVASPGRKPDTIARIYHAREVLDSQLDSPPALLKLSQFVGMSDRTLQRGFRDVFGTTVVGYLIQQRLNQAEQLLRQGNCTVAQAANQVGYSHLGRFASGFKRQFGITPSQCLAGRRST